MEKELEYIGSAENRTLKTCRRLGMKKYRQETGRYLIEGPNLIREALSWNVPLEFVLIRESRTGNPELRELWQLWKSRRRAGKTRWAAVADSLFDGLSGTLHPQGILAAAEKPPDPPPETIFASGGNLLILDRIQDPGNIGALLRTAEAAGYSGVISLKGTGDIYEPKAVRAAAGSVFRMPVLFCETPEEVLAFCRRYGKQTAAAVPGGDTVYWEAGLDRNTALIIGNEGNGVCAALAGAADRRVAIPMAGGTESLNAAAAAAILMYERARQKKPAGTEPELCGKRKETEREDQ